MWMPPSPDDNRRWGTIRADRRHVMWPVMYDLGSRGLRADALFASGLQRCDAPGTAQVRQAIAAAIRAFGRSGCAGRVAQEFGDHPETAVIRMRWARSAAG